MPGKPVLAKPAAKLALKANEVEKKKQTAGKRPYAGISHQVQMPKSISVGSAQIQSRAELLSQWNAIYGAVAQKDYKELRACLSRSPLTYSADGQEFRVSRATVHDGSALCALGDEFVRVHTSVVSSENLPESREQWCTYLGLHPDHTQRRKGYAVAASKLDRVHLLRSCTLKCEHLGTREANGDLALASKGEAMPDIVGYLHFKLEELKGERCSKRLRRQRGQSTGEYVKVTHIVVAPEYRRAGLAKLMLLAMACMLLEHRAVHVSEIFLTVAKRNEAAVRLYQSLGFTVIGENETKPAQAVKPIEWLQMGIVRSEAGSA
mmetsp:Transcript_8806/g.19571  ORF Transcript_8806/g.19571 Transcript_8806/m.19571 type:complete len:321 (+) Transcript_8806:70-1032(+)